MNTMTSNGGRFKVSHPIANGFGWWTSPTVPIRVDRFIPADRTDLWHVEAACADTRFVNVPIQAVETVESFRDAIAGQDQDPAHSLYDFTAPEWFDFWASIHPYAMFEVPELSAMEANAQEQSIAARAAYAVEQHRKSLSWWKRWLFDRLKMGDGMSHQVAKVIRIQLLDERTLASQHSYSA
jgi:hypothetical protein